MKSFDPAIYETIAQKADPMYRDMLRATETVKKFIADRKCIIYGGTAIDYALRLRGAQIYSDDKLTIPDFDFYSAKSADDGADLADILYEDGHKDARSFQAIHVTTTRVDAGTNHWIADISYIPQSLIERIPTVTYMGMLCVHPDFQRIDMHSSLTYPYDNAPSEVIFARWSKDVERLRKIDESYPVELFVDKSTKHDKSTKYDKSKLDKPIAREKLDLPLAGWGAYSALIAACVKQGAVIDGDTELPASFSVAANAYTWSAPPGNTNAEYYCDKITPTHAGYASIKPEREERKKATLYSTEDRLLSIVHVPTDDGEVISVCANGVLMYMMAEHIINCCPHARAAYKTLWRLADTGKYAFLNLSAEVYGSSNIDSAQKITMQRTLGEQIDGLPASYMPSRGKERKPFGYEGPLWTQDGRKLG